MKRVLAVIAFLGMSGCSCKLPSVTGAQPALDRRPIEIYGKPLEIRLSRPQEGAPAHFLVIYATGDGGWRGLDEQIFDWLSESGYRVAGFSSKTYLKNLVTVSDSTTPHQLVRDFEAVAGLAIRHFELPGDTRLILVGLSRGADLAAIAAGQPRFREGLAGLLVLGLTDEEEYLRHRHNRFWRDGAEGAAARGGPLDPYTTLRRVTDIPVVVIQSTNDGYVPAAVARTLFGPDTAMRRLVSVDASDHSFRGGCESLKQDLQDCIRWIAQTAGKATGSAGRYSLPRGYAR
jgi:fermentation-respiration switch protein FrsA (DUF1100 family)